VETDQSFHDIFLLRPNWLGPLTGRDIAPVRQAKPAVFKAAKVECDLLFEPEDSAHPELVVEFQLYYDASIFNRTELARCLRWKELNSSTRCRQRHYVPRQVEALIIFGDASQVWFTSGPSGVIANGPGVFCADLLPFVEPTLQKSNSS